MLYSTVYDLSTFYVAALVGFAICAGLACIPAKIAQRKGYSFGLWWVYGFFLFIIAIIHVSVIDDKKVENTAENQYEPKPTYQGQSITNELKKYKEQDEQELINLQKLKTYKELLDSGVITQAEFNKKKSELLKFSDTTAEKTWYYLVSESKAIGPCTRSEIERLILQGIIQRETGIWDDASQSWIFAYQSAFASSFE